MSDAPDLCDIDWVKSSFSSGQGGNCLEWAPGSIASRDIVPVRDSKNPGGPTLELPPSAWSSFITALVEDRISTR
ncbi:DUF397 domain-containing protein [Streptomyces olivoreticuli]